jgi:hypothetical protein
MELMGSGYNREECVETDFDKRGVDNERSDGTDDDTY